MYSAPLRVAPKLPARRANAFCRQILRRIAPVSARAFTFIATHPACLTARRYPPHRSPRTEVGRARRTAPNTAATVLMSRRAHTVRRDFRLSFAAANDAHAQHELADVGRRSGHLNVPAAS